MFYQLKTNNIDDLLTGTRNANVFPEPVLAAPSTSFPCKASPIDSLWMSVGVENLQILKPEKWKSFN